MTLKPDVLRERLLKLEEIISRLSAIHARAGESTSIDADTEWLAERGLHLGCEVIFDIGNHILSAHFGVSAQNYEDISRQLESNGVIDAELRNRFRGLGGFRNILVHGYTRIDPTVVVRMLAAAPKDFSDFADAIRKWAARLDPSRQQDR